MAFRRKDGTRQAFGVVGAISMEAGAVALAVLGAARAAGTGWADRGAVRGAGRESP